MMFAFVALVYLLIGLYFRPYSIGWSFVSGAIAHVLWLPAVILVYLVLRFGNRI
jgi:hypothetical protein